MLALPTLLLTMDLTVLHLAVLHLAADLRPSGSQLLWITDIYGFLIAGFLVTMGTLGDRIGRRRLLLIGGGAFGAASAVAAYASTPELLIAARALLGIAGGLAVLTAGSVIFALSLAPSAFLGNNLVLGTAPPERAGAASAMSETTQEFGGALGLAVLGSIGVAVYRGDMAGAVPAGIPPQAADAARDWLRQRVCSRRG